MTDLISGQVDVLVVQAAVALPQVQVGTTKAIANLSPQRSAAIPTISTSGRARVHVRPVRALRSQGDTGEAITKLNNAMVQVLAGPATRTRFAQLGLDVAPGALQTPEGLAAFHKVEIEAWWPIIRAAGIVAE